MKIFNMLDYLYSYLDKMNWEGGGERDREREKMPHLSLGYCDFSLCELVSL